jgi:DNA-directed RNA polymerase subunit RPC12/RpoP
MDLIFNCPKCGQELEVDDSGAGEEIACPACGSTIRIPMPDGAPRTASADGEAPAGSAWAPGGQHAPTIASSAAAKVKMQLKVPVHTTPTEKLIAKPLVPLEVAAKESDRHLRVKTIRHIDCVEVGHDRFDETVTNFLTKVGEANVVSVTPLNYSHIDISSQKLLADYGVLIMYRG